MKDNSLKLELINRFKEKNQALINEIILKVNQTLNGKRKVMYSDIINYINRSDPPSDVYNEIIIWCNYKIRYGKIFVECQ